jgi:hypothetical protein
VYGFLTDRSPDGFERLARIRLRHRLRRLARPAWLGTVRRTKPLSDHWGSDRGTPVDRHYIERFLAEHRQDIRGRVLEVRDRRYTDRFGSGVEMSDVLDIDATNPRATIVADLSAADTIASDQFDCFVLTQTLQFIYDVKSALCHSHRILRPGGVLLATVPSLSRTAPYDLGGDFWRFTAASCANLFEEQFGKDAVTVTAWGNVLTDVAFLLGMASEELSSRELAEHDPLFPLVVAVRAVKRPASGES